MNQISDIIKTFFEEFERASNLFDPDLLASQFSDPFMAAGAWRYTGGEKA